MNEPEPPRAPVDRNVKIWRYIDLHKYVSLLSTRCLYFPRPSAFHDPYEGWLPRSYLKALGGVNQNYVDRQNEMRKAFADTHPHADLDTFNAAMDASIETMIARAKEALPQVIARFGVSCWHRSDYEAEALWRTYPADCIAVESTAGQLIDGARHDKTTTVDFVRYADFDADPIEKGHRESILFMKRKSFAYEQELRACAFLGDGQDGAFLSYDLDQLITRIHISPRASSTFLQVVKDVSSGGIEPLAKPITPSRLYEKPDYTLDLRPK